MCLWLTLPSVHPDIEQKQQLQTKKKKNKKKERKKGNQVIWTDQRIDWCKRRDTVSSNHCLLIPAWC